MKKFIVAMFLAVIALSVQAQSKYHVDLNYYYNLGLSERIVGKNYGRSYYKMGGNSLRLSARYDINKTLSAGLGIGVERYTEMDFNTFPLFVTLQCTPIKNVRNAYAFTDFGYALKFTSDSNPGFTGKLGVGYLLHLAKHFGLKLQIAYDFKDFREIPTLRYDEAEQQSTVYDSNSLRHSLSFGVGLVF